MGLTADKPHQTHELISAKADDTVNRDARDKGAGSGLKNPGAAVTTDKYGNAWYGAATRDAYQGDASGYDADKMKVTDDMLVENRLANIMKSPVGRIAQQIASEQMNSRGMMDSTAAINAITMAAIQAGLPIAEADAAKFYDAAQTNMAAENEQRRYNTEADNLMGQRNANAIDNARAANTDALNRQREFNVQNLQGMYKFNKELGQRKYEFDKNSFQEMYKFNRELALEDFVQKSKLRLEDARFKNEAGQVATTYMQDIWASGMKPEHARKAFLMGFHNGILSWKQASEGIKNYAGHMVEVKA
jgi:hypothetical protein